jgi:hypothetical protein
MFEYILDDGPCLAGKVERYRTARGYTLSSFNLDVEEVALKPDRVLGNVC